MTQHIKCPKLPYAQDALQPHMSKHSVHYHYEKRTQGYYKKVNELINDTLYQDSTLEQIISESSDIKAPSTLYNQAAQAYNHTAMWENLSPPGTGGQISDQLKAAIMQQYGTFNSFKSDFVDQSIKRFASGWAWLLYNTQTKELSITTTANAINPISNDKNLRILFVVDLWEHAYEYDYNVDRKKYLNNCFQILNWNVINQRYEQAIGGSDERH